MSRTNFSDNQLADLLMQLNGEIEPIGESNTDNNRLVNLIKLEGVLDLLLEEMAEVCKYCDRPEASMSKAGKHAVKWVSTTKEWFDSIVSVYKEEDDTL